MFQFIEVKEEEDATAKGKESKKKENKEKEVHRGFEEAKMKY